MKRAESGISRRPGIEQRRSQRFACSLMVELVHGTHRQVVHTLDVSQHGLFVATDQPPRERFLVQLSIHLPGGGAPVPATAFVSREVLGGHGARAGVGLQLFALAADAKTRWDRFIASLGGLSPAPMSTASIAPIKASRELDRPAFLLKLRDGARLLEFYEKNVTSGGLYLATPVIKEPGSEIALIVIHPVTENEQVLFGRVERVHRVSPKGMEIRLQALDAQMQEAFRRFVTSGVPSDLGGPPPVVPLKEESLDIVIEEPVLYDRQFEWGDVSDELIVDLDLSEYETADPAPAEISVDIEEPVSVDLPPSVAPELSPDATPDFSLQASDVLPEAISVDLEAPSQDLAPPQELAPSQELAPPVEPSEVETWRGPRLPAPDEVAQEVSIVVPVPPELSTHEAPTRDLEQSREEPAPTLAALAEDAPTSEMSVEVPKKRKRAQPTGHEPATELRIVCMRCTAPPMNLTIGGIDGHLGLLARLRAYWCNRCTTLVGVPRLKPSPERRLILARLGGPRAAKLEETVPLAFVFEVAGLAGSSPRCPICSSPVRVNTLVRVLEEMIPRLEETPRLELPRAHCPQCKETHLQLELIAKRETR